MTSSGQWEVNKFMCVSVLVQVDVSIQCSSLCSLFPSSEGWQIPMKLGSHKMVSQRWEKFGFLTPWLEKSFPEVLTFIKDLGFRQSCFMQQLVWITLTSTPCLFNLHSGNMTEFTFQTNNSVFRSKNAFI